MSSYGDNNFIAYNKHTKIYCIHRESEKEKLLPKKSLSYRHKLDIVTSVRIRY